MRADDSDGVLAERWVNPVGRAGRYSLRERAAGGRLLTLRPVPPTTCVRPAFRRHGIAPRAVRSFFTGIKCARVQVCLLS
jgi:hypothetical protein